MNKNVDRKMIVGIQIIKSSPQKADLPKTWDSILKIRINYMMKWMKISIGKEEINLKMWELPAPKL